MRKGGLEPPRVLPHRILKRVLNSAAHCLTPKSLENMGFSEAAVGLTSVHAGCRWTLSGHLAGASTDTDSPGSSSAVSVDDRTLLPPVSRQVDRPSGVGLTLASATPRAEVRQPIS